MNKQEITGKITCLVIDDDSTAHEVLEQLMTHIKWMVCLPRCYSGIEAVERIANEKPDVIFLDIKMAGLSGLELLKVLPLPRPHVIMISGDASYAIDGYEYQVVDFLLKPFSLPPLMRAASKIKELSISRTPQPELENLDPVIRTVAVNSRVKSFSGPKYLWVWCEKKYIRIAFEKIYAVEGAKDYVKIHYDESFLMTYGSLGLYQPKLPKQWFVKINRSFLVNKTFVHQIANRTVILSNKKEYTIPLSMDLDQIVNELTNL